MKALVDFWWVEFFPGWFIHSSLAFFIGMCAYFQSQEFKEYFHIVK